jgi:hypothetical protein
MAQTRLPIVLVVSHLRAFAFWTRICLSPLLRCFLILHDILDILPDDHLVAPRAAWDTAAVAVAVMPGSSLVVILAIGDNPN